MEVFFAEVLRNKSRFYEKSISSAPNCSAGKIRQKWGELESVVQLAFRNEYYQTCVQTRQDLFEIFPLSTLSREVSWRVARKGNQRNRYTSFEDIDYSNAFFRQIIDDLKDQSII